MTAIRPCVSLVAVLICSSVGLSAQSQFQFVVSATDATGAPVTDLRPDDVVMSEDGVKQKVVKVEPLAVPIKLTIAVDNGSETADVIAQYRNGLAELVDALPADVEVTVIATAPQPRTVVKPTTNHTQLTKGINSFGPEQGNGRFSDTFVEYSDRLQREAKDKKTAPYAPVLLMLSTAAPDRTTYQPKDIEKAAVFLTTRHARLNVVMISTHPGDVSTAAALGTSQQAVVARPVVKATNGRYEEVSVANRLTTLLAQWGHDLATLHARQTAQFLVTVERTRSGDLQAPRVELARPGLTGAVTRDGYLP